MQHVWVIVTNKHALHCTVLWLAGVCASVARMATCAIYVWYSYCSSNIEVEVKSKKNIVQLIILGHYLLGSESFQEG